MGVQPTGMVIGFLVLFVLNLPMAKASWMIDPERFHASAHGQTSCQECHEDVVDRELHPGPLQVTKSAKDFFHIEECLACHDSIMEDLEEGKHGSLKIKSRDPYKDCLRCHDPHYQKSLTDPAKKKFKPAKAVKKQCGACHDVRNALPPFSEEDATCMTCHRAVAADTPEETERINTLCLHCHGMSGTRAQVITQQFVPLIDAASHEGTVHADVACTTCHKDAAAYTHDVQQPRNCGQCHLPHDEKNAGDAHMQVSCQACHLKGVRAVRDTVSNCILWEREQRPDGKSIVHEMVLFQKETACQRCHYAGNMLGAAAMALPPKSIICMLCHTATFSIGDTITMISLIIFACGLILFFGWWLSGSMPGLKSRNPFSKLAYLTGHLCRTVFSSRIVDIGRALFWDVLLQRRLYRRSRNRWIIHALIFYGFVFRFGWGILGVIGSLWKPEWPVVWVLVNKNYPLTGILFDITGLMILVGAALAFARGWLNRANRPAGLPEQDRLALGLIAGIVVIGFVVEGMRIALTGYPPGSGYSVIGYGLALLFTQPRGLVEVYGFVWYIHAALTGAFIAYIPFSRLLHIIIAPVVVAMNAAGDKRKESA